MELATIATVTSGHLDAEAAKVLNQKFEQGNHHPDTNHWSNDLVWASFDYGWLLSLNRDRFDESKPEFAENKDLPECLLKVALYARKRGARWICFDQDGPEVKGLETYDW